MDSRRIEKRLQVGLLTILITFESTDAELCDRALAQADALVRPFQGVATEDELKLALKLLNGPTLDHRLGRVKAKPCGCRGKG